VRSALQVPAPRFLIDGEAVCCDADGMADFQRLHSREHDASAFLYAFDLLMLDGADIRDEPLRIAAPS
jgi:ATP-dependent DNA ligase